MTTPIKLSDPTKARRNGILSCDECGREISVLAHQDPELGDGWPLHRCPATNGEPRAFDRFDVVIPLR